VAVVAAVVMLGGGLAIRYAFVTSPDQAAVSSAPRISDTGFEQGATATCQHYVHVFDTATTLSRDPSAQDSGRFLDTIATNFDHMVVALSALPVAPVDRAAVAQWLSDWRAYDAYGHQYAVAVSNGAERDLVHNDKSRIDGLLRRRNGFAKANHMNACAFN
jgi:hypothetical protein